MISTLSCCQSEDFHVVDYVTRPRPSLLFLQPRKEECILEPLTNRAAKMQCSLGFVKFIASVCEWTANFSSLTKVLFGLLIFFSPEVMLEIGGVAYTQVRLIHESTVFSFCNFCFCCWFFFSLELKFLMFFTQPKPPKHISTGMRNNDGTDAGFQQYLLNIVE